MNDMTVHYSSNKSDWGTPKGVFEILDHLFKFTVDACANETNALCPSFWSESNSFLASFPARPESIFMNPPYGRGIKPFVNHLNEVCINGTTGVALLPARTDTKWFQTVWSHANVAVFFRGRLKFKGAPSSAPFPSCLALFNHELTTTEHTTLDQLGHVVVLR